MTITLQDEPLDAGAILRDVVDPRSGAQVLFQGTVRDENLGEPVDFIVYEAYEAMARKAMAGIAAEIAERWPALPSGVQSIALAHRTGRLVVGEASVIVAVSAGHRAEAFEAARHGIDRLKESVTIWKREEAASGPRWLRNAESASGCTASGEGPPEPIHT